MVERYDLQESRKMHTPHIQALEVSIATGSPRISAADVYRSPKSTPV